MKIRYDVIVIGAGHAGCEAAAAAAKLGSKTLLLTLDMNKIAQMSCNPAVGGIAKGQIVREIDALGGEMGIITDATAIQFRMLNRSKGPAMWSPRAQSDRMRFMEAWRERLDAIENLEIFQDEAIELIITKDTVSGVKTKLGAAFIAPTVVLTAGTFLGGEMHFGKTRIAGGRISEPASFGLTKQLTSYGFKTDRMKTGTPVRIDGRSVHFDETTPQYGEDDFHRFSFINTPAKTLAQRPCFTLYTNTKCHDILRASLSDSPLYNGQIQSIGPRYCPSIETKIVTFAEKEMHQLFLEPEGETTQEYYLNGFSSSLPMDVQLEALKAIPALRDVRIYRPGYAIEYDFFDPTQLFHTMETKLIKGLFFAGQINGTTGYEEAAGQGLIAGINAHLKASNSGKEFALRRDEAYIGVLIDDLVTKGVDEPYRMFTSRAEHRIILRQDDADIRLTPKAIELGLASTQRETEFQEKRAAIEDLIRFISTYSIKPADINSYLESCASSPLRQGTKLNELIQRPQLTLSGLASAIPHLRNRIEKIGLHKDEVIEAVEIKTKYAGYIEREKIIASKLQRLENVRLPKDMDYASITSLSTEARQKLEKIKPETIAQASRIPGISPHDISILLVLMGR